MEKVSQRQTESERADLDAIAALKESSAIEFKEKGNECVKKGKKHFSEAIDCYTRAINQQALTDSDTSILFSNRAHALCRAAKASFSLNLLSESASHCENELKHDLGNEELKKLLRQIELNSFSATIMGAVLSIGAENTLLWRCPRSQWNRCYCGYTSRFVRYTTKNGMDR
ncbi:hypothetical protein ACFXTH_035654 [Malus domestica]